MLSVTTSPEAAAAMIFWRSLAVSMVVPFADKITSPTWSLAFSAGEAGLTRWTVTPVLASLTETPSQVRATGAAGVIAGRAGTAASVALGVGVVLSCA